ncbi:hypothetical protein LIER_21459 [Lithospermum erythrorhizon]|uniref:MIR domain-containing protein n=1 Tax=Lithospermum erythrorhizon TaxID=34254 RepID=A0AAV3QQF9_LITER
MSIYYSLALAIFLFLVVDSTASVAFEGVQVTYGSTINYWIVRPALNSSVKQGDLIQSGTVIKLQHMRTRRWLHSHLHKSPISGNNMWQNLETRPKDQASPLHSHNKKYSRIAGGQQKVCGMKAKRIDNIWLAAEGVYLPVSESKEKSPTDLNISK